MMRRKTCVALTLLLALLLTGCGGREASGTAPSVQVQETKQKPDADPGEFHALSGLWELQSVAELKTDNGPKKESKLGRLFLSFEDADGGKTCAATFVVGSGEEGAHLLCGAAESKGDAWIVGDSESDTRMVITLLDGAYSWHGKPCFLVDLSIKNSKEKLASYIANRDDLDFSGGTVKNILYRPDSRFDRKMDAAYIFAHPYIGSIDYARMAETLERMGGIPPVVVYSPLFTRYHFYLTDRDNNLLESTQLGVQQLALYDANGWWTENYSKAYYYVLYLVNSMDAYTDHKPFVIGGSKEIFGEESRYGGNVTLPAKGHSASFWRYVEDDALPPSYERDTEEEYTVAVYELEMRDYDKERSLGIKLTQRASLGKVGSVAAGIYECDKRALTVFSDRLAELSK